MRYFRTCRILWPKETRGRESASVNRIRTSWNRKSLTKPISDVETDSPKQEVSYPGPHSKSVTEPGAPASQPLRLRFHPLRKAVARSSGLWPLEDRPQQEVCRLSALCL